MSIQVNSNNSDRFFYIFRNKYLWSLISFYLKSKNLGVAKEKLKWRSYEEYLSIESMIYSKQISLLSWKLKDNQSHINKLVFTLHSLRRLFQLNNQIVKLRKSFEKSQELNQISLGLSGSSFHLCDGDNSNNNNCINNDVSNIANRSNNNLLRLLIYNYSSSDDPDTIIKNLREKEEDIFYIFKTLFYKHQSMIESSCFIIDTAVESRSLEIVKILHYTDIKMSKTMNGVKYASPLAMDVSSRYGDMDILEFLHLNRSEGATTNAMDLAASNNHLNIVEFLHSNRIEGCTVAAVEMAAIGGHYEIVKFLCSHRKEGFRHFIFKQCEEKGYTNIISLLTNFNNNIGSYNGSYNQSGWFSSLFSNVKIQYSLYSSPDISLTNNNNTGNTNNNSFGFEDLKIKTNNKKSWMSWNWS